MTRKSAAPQELSTYISPSHPIEEGKAPGMKVQLIRDGDAKEFAVIFAKGDEAFSGLMEFAERYHVGSGHFTAIGALSRATLGWFDLQKKMYREDPDRRASRSAIHDWRLRSLSRQACATHAHDGRTS